MNNSYLSNLDYNAGIYIRLSQEDKDKKYESDSESVSNQKEILRNYCKHNGFNLVNEYVDDGYSGTNFDRPGFAKMIEDIKAKKINLVIVKDLSRLGRDHVMTGYYIETYFPENKVRFISIVENYDSMKNQASNDSSTFIIACNDYYSKQNSLKVRNVLDSKRIAGKFIGSKPCYGYIRDPDDKGHLIPDPEVCEYVKKIFEWKSNEIGISEIATRLTKLGAPTPAEYKNMPLSPRVRKKDEWSAHSVYNILKNRMYTGDMVQHTQTNVSYKSKKKITLDENLWIIVENTHEPLVDKETFMLINRKKKNKNRTYQKRKRAERLLEGLLFCKECGNRLGILYRKKQDYWCINCNRYARDPVRRLCEPHFFAYNYFEELVLKEIKNCLDGLFNNLNYDDLNDEIIKRTKNNSNDFLRKKENIEKEQIKISESMQTLYQDRLDGNISLEQYKVLSIPIEEKLKNLNRQLEDINMEIIKRKHNVDKIPNYINKIKKLLNLSNPNRDLLFALIEKIEADKDRNISITFKYDILDTYTFKYYDNRIHNPFGRNGKKMPNP